MKKSSFILLIIIGSFLLFVIYWFSFVLNYSPGNVPDYTYVPFKYKREIFYQYTDTFLLKHPEYRDPYSMGEKDTNLAHLRMVTLYFKQEPEERYDISISSGSVRYIYKMKGGRILQSIDKLSDEDNERIKKRINIIWDEIGKMIENANLADSVKYYNKK